MRYPNSFGAPSAYTPKILVNGYELITLNGKKKQKTNQKKTKNTKVVSPHFSWKIVGHG